MRNPIRRELFARFGSELKHRLPQFERCGAERAASGKDYAMWAWEVVPTLTFFVMVQPFERDDQFTVEIAWSDDGKFPWREMGLRFFKIECPKSRRRLARLWASGKMEPVWEVVPRRSFEETRARIKAMSRGDRDQVKRIEKVPEVPLDEAIPRIAPLVDDALQKFVEYGLALFLRVVKHRDLA